MTTRGCTQRFRLTAAELREVWAVVPRGALSELVRSLLLNHIRSNGVHSWVIYQIPGHMDLAARATAVKAVAAIDPGDGARLELHGRNRCWVVYHGRTDPFSVGDLVRVLCSEIRVALGIEIGA